MQPAESIRMGSHVALGRVTDDRAEHLVVGRPYGDPQEGKKIAVGDAFILDGGARVPLPVYRGVSAVAVGNVSGGKSPDIVVGDGWHSDYGKLARARLAIMHRQDGKWTYELIEDVPGFIRIVEIQLVDLDGDGKAEILALAEEATSSKPGLRLYEHTSSGWRGTTLATGTRAFTVADLEGNHRPELILSGDVPQKLALDLRRMSWDAQLAKAQQTFLADPAALVGKAAPDFVAEEWIGPQQSLAALKGRVVLLDFWATWCTPCINTFPALQTMLDTYGAEGFSIVGLTNHSDQTSADVRRFLKRKPLGWPVGIDSKSRPHMAYGTQGLPHQVLIDRKGVVRFFYVGGEQHEKIERDVKTLLAEKAG
jgi:thiol-disulfide isomerase/thioredoxin